MNYSIKTILVPVDFSQTSLNAVNTAVQICKRHNATLHLVHVTGPEYLYPAAGMQAPVFRLADEILSSEVDNLINYAASIKRMHNIQCVSHTEVGSVVSSIRNLAEKKDCDLVVVGTGANSNTWGFLSSNIAYKILSDVRCPVLTVPEGKKINRFKKVLFPVRPVLNATRKSDFCERILLKNQSDVHIVGALHIEDVAKYPTVRKLVNTVERKFDKGNISYRSEYHFSKDIAKTMLDTCSKLSTDLIIITATTRRNLKQLFYGNYAQQIINNDQAAVLCIKPNISMGSESFAALSTQSAI